VPSNVTVTSLLLLKSPVFATWGPARRRGAAYESCKTPAWQES
jgi:hypothetical protein